MKTTIGQLLINEKLPQDLRDYSRVLDKKNLRGMLFTLAKRHPDIYGRATTDLNRLGYKVAFHQGSSFSLDDLRAPPDKEDLFNKAEKSVASIRMRIADPKKRDAAIINEYQDLQAKLTASSMKNGLKTGNRLAQMVHSGARGNANQLSSTVASAVLYSDHKQRPILVPVKSSFAEGYDPAEYWTSSYGTRRGMISTKFATQDAGALAKLFSQANFQQVVTMDDCETLNGVPQPVSDTDNIDAFLARDIGPYKRNDLITANMLSELTKRGIQKIIVRSPITCAAPKGICAKCRGLTEKGILASVGDNIGLISAAAMAEPVSQMQLNVKHTGGVAGVGGAGSGYAQIKQLTGIPKSFPNRAELSRVNGKIEEIKDAPQGGTYITIGGQNHYSLPGMGVTVKVGDTVEEGDALDKGLINPAEIVKYKGLGEGRRYFTEALQSAFKAANSNVNRRHIEVMSRALINKAQVDDGSIVMGALPDDLVDFQHLQNTYKPKNTKTLGLDQSIGRYLAKPVLHYTVGTKVQPSVAKQLNKYGYKTVETEEIAPPFRPIMIRIQDSPKSGSDWMTQLYSTGLKKTLLQATHKGRKAPEHSLSFVPSLLRGAEFGRARGKGPLY